MSRRAGPAALLSPILVARLGTLVLSSDETLIAAKLRLNAGYE